MDLVEDGEELNSAHAAQDQIDYSKWCQFDIAEIGIPALEQMRLDITHEINRRRRETWQPI